VIGQELVRGARFIGPSQVELFEEIATPPKGDEVLVRVHSVGICGTDLGLYLGNTEEPTDYPICFGHEWAGVVEAVGGDVSRLRVGDWVVGECSLWCGECEYCARDRNLCERVEKFGITTAGAARTRILQKERYLHPAEPGTDPQVLVLAEPLAVAALAVQRAAQVHDRPLSSSRILVLGGGMIGLACLLVLRLLYGCQSVAVSDPLAARMERARGLGGSKIDADIQHALDHSAATSYSDLYGSGRYDLLFETSGSRTAFESLIPLARPLATAVCVGFIPQACIDPSILTFKAMRIIGTIGGSGAFDQALTLCRRHPELLRPLITQVYSRSEVDQAFAAVRDPRAALKVLIQMNTVQELRGTQ
jgi:L-iditol 2-dehydrogenase